MPSRDLVFRFLGIDGGAGREFERMAGKSSALEHSIGKLGIGFAAAGVAIGVESIRAAAKFQTAMELIHTQAGRSQATVDAMSKSVLALAGPTATAPEELAKGLYHLASTGMSAAKTMAALRIAAEGAKLGGADLESVTNALNATLASGIKGAQNMSQAMGALNATVGAGDMRMQDLSEAMGTGFLAAVKGFGVNLNDVGAALATFGDNNIRGADAATQLRMAVLFMAKPAAGAKDALKSLGMTSHTLADDMREHGLGGALEDLHKRLLKAGDTGAKMGQVLLDMFGHKAGTGISILEQQYSRFQQKQEEVHKGSKSFASDWTAYTQTFGYSWDRARSSFESMTIQIGTKLLPTATKAMNWIGTTGVSDLEKFTGWVSRNKTPIEDVAKALAAIAAVRFGAGLIGKVNAVGKMLSGGGGGVLGTAEGAAGVRVFVTNMPLGGPGGPGGPGPVQTAEKDAEKYGPAALPFLSKLKWLTRIGPGVALTGATLTDKLGPATVKVPGGSVRADAPGNMKALLAQVHEITAGNAAAARSFKALGGSIDVKKLQTWVATWQHGNPVLQDTQKNASVLNRYLVQNTGLARHNIATTEEGRRLLHQAAVAAVQNAKLQAQAAKDAARAHHTAVAGMVADLKKIPGAWAQVAAQARAAGNNIGAQLDAGITVAIQGNAGKVNLVTKQMIDGVIHTAHTTAQLGSPSKRTHYIGRMLSEGLAAGVTHGAPKAVDAVKKLLDRVTAQFDTARGNAFGLRDSVIGSLTGGASLSNMPLAATTTGFGTSGTAAPTAHGVSVFLSDYARRERAFARNLALGRKHGLSASLVAQIAQMGLDQGGPIAAALAGASKATIRTIDASQHSIEVTAGKIGTAAEKAVYGHQLAVLTAELREIKALLASAPHHTGAAVAHAMTTPHAARKLGTSANKARRAK